MSSRQQNEKKFGTWEELHGGGRRYRLDVPGRLGWLARYFEGSGCRRNHRAVLSGDLQRAGPTGRNPREIPGG